MAKITVKGLSSSNRRRLRKMMRTTVQTMNNPVEIEVQSPVFHKRQDSLWFGGIEAEIRYRGWRFELWANGDVYADLYELPDMRHLFYVKDKNNAGNLAGELITFIGSDRALYAAELGKHPKYRLDLDHNNWWEAFAVAPDGEFIDMMWCLESDGILPAIAEIVESMDEIIQREEKERGSEDSVVQLNQKNDQGEGEYADNGNSFS